jgi:ribosomal protein S18 acetylase RimI-like enzyme
MPEKRPAQNVVVRPGSAEEQKAATCVFADAFRSEGFTSWMFDLSSPQKQARFVRANDLMLTLWHEKGQIFLVAVIDEEIVGMAVLSAPNPKNTASFWRLACIALPRLPDLIAMLGLIRWHRAWPAKKAAQLPKTLPDPYHTLEALAVAPAHQGRGIARLLLEAAHAASDNDPQSAGTYLYTADARNRAIYERFGYGLVEQRVGGEALTVYHMFRPKRAASASTTTGETTR